MFRQASPGQGERPFASRNFFFSSFLLLSPFHDERHSNGSKMTQAGPEVDAKISNYADTSPGPFNGFEGAEKLLELWFCPSEQYVEGLERKGGRTGKAKWTGLRQVEKKVWDDMLDEVQCKVLSVIEGEDVDAYLLRLVPLLSSRA